MHHNSQRQNNRYKFVLIALWFVSFINFYFPSFNNIFDSVGRQGFLLHSIVMFVVLAMFLIVLRAELSKALSLYLLVFMLMSCDILFTAFLSNELSIRDLFELFRPALFFLMVWLGFEIAKVFQYPEKIALKVVLVPMSIMIVVALLLYFFPREFRGGFWSFYNKPSLIASNRLAGTFVNPYDFVLLASLVLTFAYLKFIENGFPRYVILGLVSCAVIILSQSKIGFVLIVVAIFTTNFCVLNLMLRNKEHALWVWLRFLMLPFLFTLLIALAFIYYNDQISYLANGLSRMLDGGDKSTQIRAEQIALGIEIWTSSFTNIIFGAGAMKSSGLNFENLYVLYLVRYGLIGIVLIIFLVFAPLIISFRLWKRSFSTERTLLFVFFILSATAGISNNNIDQMRISFVYYLLVGVALYLATVGKQEIKVN